MSGVASFSGLASGLDTNALVTSLVAIERRPIARVQVKQRNLMSITVGAAAAVDVTIAATDTLADVADNINNSGAEVQAAVVFDGANYRLQVMAKDPGLTNAVSFGESPGITLGLSVAGSMIVPPLDANFSVNGLSMTRSSNTVQNAIPGVTLELKAPTAAATPITVNIVRDTEPLKGKLEDFITNYNFTIQLINKEFAYTGEARVGDSLSGDAALRGMKDRLAMTVVTSLSGFTSPYNRLASLGITTQNDGTLEFEAATFDDVMATNEDEVITFFIGDATAGTIGLAETFDDLISQYVDSGDGILTKKVSGYSDQVSDIDDQIDDMERRIDKYEQRLRMQFAAMEQAISQMQSQGSQMMGMLQSLQKR
jgi:flagellar hook-associated protein 2